MDNEILITLRLLKSGGKDFNLQVTRYANSQNPVSDRDFHANDEVQIRLQQESFKTKFWYEKREGEFRENVPDDIKIISNKICAKAYLAYELQDPINTIIGCLNQNLLFVSSKEHQNGLYEKIFNENTKFEDILCSVYLSYLIEEFIKKAENEGKSLYMKYNDISILTYNLSFYLGLFKIVFSKYLLKKKEKNIPINEKIIKLFDKE